jgi:LmbE family N-acetylglucosaminyl deacetylase
MRDYLIYAQDYEYEVDANCQLLEHLKRERPDAIFIPMTSAMPNLRPPDHVKMLDFVRLIVASVRPELIDVFFNNRSRDGWIDRDELEPIQCHLTPEVNALVAGCVESALITGIWAPQLPEYVQHGLAWEDYYRETTMFGSLIDKFK